MIRKNELNCKLKFIKSSSQSLIEQYMAAYRIEKEECPTCGKRGGCHIHAYYERYIIDFINGHVKTVRIRILRVICDCGHTHAILPDPIIPYESHSIFFILHVLAEYFMHTKTIAEICRVYVISASTFYRWRSTFKEHRIEWQGLMSAIETCLRSTVHALINQDPFAELAVTFFESTGISFMQSHANPAYNRRGAPPGKCVFSWPHEVGIYSSSILFYDGLINQS